MGSASLSEEKRRTLFEDVYSLSIEFRDTRKRDWPVEGESVVILAAECLHQQAEKPSDDRADDAACRGADQENTDHDKPNVHWGNSIACPTIS